MKTNFGQIVFLLLALKSSGAGKRHISYKKVILISNACQPTCTDYVRPQLPVLIDKTPIPNKIPDNAEQKSDFGYHTSF